MDSDFQLGPWWVQPELHTFSRGDEVRRVGHKVVAVLLCLAAEPGRVVSKEALIEQIWEGAFTTDEALATVVYELRKALDDDAKQPTYIETIRKRGYRLIAPVTECATRPADAAPGAADATRPLPERRVPWRRVVPLAAAALSGAVLAASALLWWPAPAPLPEADAAASIRTLAVHPLATVSEECKEDFFGDGLTEMLIADLGALGPLEVLPSAGVETAGDGTIPSAAAQAADARLEGSVLRSGERIWVSVQLIDARSGHLVWGGTYERQIFDALTLQRELALEIAHQIEDRVMPVPERRLALARVVAPQAVEALHMGRYFLRLGTPEGTAKAERYFSRAVALDPDLAVAHAGLADTYLATAAQRPVASRGAVYEQAEQAAETALALDAAQPQAHLSLADVYFQHEWDWQRAEHHFRRGCPDGTCTVEELGRYARYLSAMGRHEEAIAVLERGLEHDPASKTGRCALAWVYFMARRYDDALGELEKAAELDPTYAPISSLERDLFLATGQYQEALQACQRALQQAGFGAGDLASLDAAFQEAGAEGMQRWLLAQAPGQRATAPADPIWMARLEAQLGDEDAALDWLRKAYEVRADELIWIKVDPAFDSLRDTPRFRDLLERLALGA